MLQPGTVVAGKYRIERLLGEGGMGAVYVAVNERLQKRVALKVLSAHVASAPGAAERFTQEAIAASSARHPGIVEIFDADVHEGTPWIAMELLEGESLREVLDRGPLPPGDALWVASEALAAILTVHAAGIIHRDLKPDNLFIERLPNGQHRVKVLDFGIAKVTTGQSGRLTQTGTTMGTPDYLAPEQAADAGQVDQRADVYSMGAILFHAITGMLPYEAQSFGELVKKMFTAGPHRALDAAPSMPPALAQLIDRCLSVDAASRPPTAAALKEEIDRVRATLGTLPAAAAVAATAQAPAVSSAAGPAAPEPPATAPVSGTTPGAWVGAAGTAVAPPSPDAPVMTLPRKSALPTFAVAASVLLLAGLTVGGYFTVRALRAARSSAVSGADSELDGGPRAASVTIASGVSGDLFLDGRSDGRVEPGQQRVLSVSPGEHVIEVRDGDYVRASAELSVAAGFPYNIQLVSDDAGLPAPPSVVQSPTRTPTRPQPAAEATTAFADVVRRTLAPSSRQFQRCYQSLLRSRRDAEGRFVMRITVAPTGRASRVEVVTDDFNDRTMAACMTGIVERARFRPAPQSTQTIVYPMVFRSQRSQTEAEGTPATAAPSAERIRACRNAPRCVIDLLRGRATTEPDMRALLAAYAAQGDSNSAEPLAREYLRRYPSGPLAPRIRAELGPGQ